MKAVLQRVSSASVQVGDRIVSEIGTGLLVLFAVSVDADEAEMDWLVKKISQMRIFSDEAGQMNLSVNDVVGDIIVVSQFTLFASTKKGNRPSFIHSAKPPLAIPMYEKFVKELQNRISGKVLTGEFGANMKVSLVNDGPVTIVLDTNNKV